MAKTDILDVITPDQAVTVLKQLAATEPKIGKQAREIAMKLVGDVDLEGVGEDVFGALDAIPVEQVWDRSGRKRDGYVAPGEAAAQVIEEALQPFLDALRNCQQLGLTEQAKRQCMGILKGIHRFEKECRSEFKDWAVDLPGEYFAFTYQEWRKGSKSRKDIEEVRQFVRAISPGSEHICK